MTEKLFFEDFVSWRSCSDLLVLSIRVHDEERPWEVTFFSKSSFIVRQSPIVNCEIRSLFHNRDDVSRVLVQSMTAVQHKGFVAVGRAVSLYFPIAIPKVEALQNFSLRLFFRLSKQTPNSQLTTLSALSRSKVTNDTPST